MYTKKLWPVLVFFAVIITRSPGQDREAMDLILLLDTSTAMSGSYLELRDYITGPFLREFLRMGDTFHLVSMAETARREISRRVEDAGDVEAVISRLCLMYPLEPSSNISAALDYTKQYMGGLPGTRRKIVVLITSANQNIPSDAVNRLSRGNTSVHLVSFPFTGNTPVSGRTPLRKTGAPTASGETASVELAKAESAAVEPAQDIQNPGDDANAVQTAQEPAGAEAALVAQAQPQKTQKNRVTPPARQTSQTPASQRVQSGRPVSPPSREIEAEVVQPLVAEAVQTAPPVSEQSVQAQEAEAIESALETLVNLAEQPPQTKEAEAAAIPVQRPEPLDTHAKPAVTSRNVQPQLVVRQAPASQPEQTARQILEIPVDQARVPEPPVQETAPPPPVIRVVQPSLPPLSPVTGVFLSIPEEDAAIRLMPKLFIALSLGITGYLALTVYRAGRRLEYFPQKALAYAADRSMAVSAGVGLLARIEKRTAALSRYRHQGQGGLHEQPRRSGPTTPLQGVLMLSLFVEDQGTASTGRRNIHAVKPGYTYSLGGGNSDFLIFLVPLPPHIAEIRCEDNSCTFIPKKAEFFPDLGSAPLYDCIDKPIRIAAGKKYEFSIRLESGEDPSKTLNRLVRSIKLPEEA